MYENVIPTENKTALVDPAAPRRKLTPAGGFFICWDFTNYLLTNIPTPKVVAVGFSDTSEARDSRFKGRKVMVEDPAY